MTKKLFSLVIPTYNEAKNIGILVNRVHEVLKDQPHEVLVMDDDSPDQTWKVVEDLSVGNPWLKSVRRTGERGLSIAVLDGFEQSKGDLLGVMDADLSHDENILPQLIEAIYQGCEMTIGSRRVPGGGADKWPWYRKFTSQIATSLAKWLIKVDVSDPMSGYFVIKRELFDKCRSKLKPKGYKIMLEIFCRSRPKKWKEIPFVFKDRTQGYSKLSGSVIINFLLMIWSLRKSNPTD